jgi:heptaprenyl diphosphate synthase
VGESPLLTELSVRFALESRLADACRHVLQTDGKQLRPSLVREAARFGPRPDDPSVGQAAAAVELLHLASLTHDDVIDGGEMRRGTSTARALYGDSASVLSGGCLYARAVQLLASTGDVATKLFCEAAAEITEGQMLETEDLFNSERTVQRYMAAVEGKTAVLFALSAQLGALLSGGEEKVIEELATFGHELGVAFQIADDVLDLVAGDLITGKAQGNDVRRGVYTLPLLYAIETDPGLAQLLAEEDVADAGLPELCSRVGAAGGFERALFDCELRIEAAKAPLVELPGSEGLGLLADLLVEKCREEIP